MYAYAINRGNSAESIFALKNYANTNTNTISTTQWNQRENTREALRGNGVLKEGNEYNTKAYLGELGGSEKGDNLAPLVGIAVRVAIATGSWVAKKAIKKLYKKCC